MLNGMSLAGYYEHLETDRAPYLRRARKVSKLTIPTLLPPEGYTGGDLPEPWQDLGSRGVKSLASKMMLALFPPNQSFVRYQLDSKFQGAIDQSGQGGQVNSEIQSSLSQAERQINKELENQTLRPNLHECMEHLLVAGNVLLHAPMDEPSRVVHLSNYVVDRDPMGKVLAIVVKEVATRTSLSPEVQSLLKTPAGPPSHKRDNEVVIYTGVCLEGHGKAARYKVWQEVEGERIPGTDGEYRPEHLPWVPLRMDKSAGQNYAYGPVAHHLGGLGSLDGLWRALIESSAISAKTIFLVSPTAHTRPNQLAQAENGQFVTGMPEDIVPMRVDKAADMGIAYNAIERLERTLGFSFLLNQSVQRQGERVTAEEIKTLAQELEDVLAGTYSLLTQEMQMVLAKLLQRKLEMDGAMPKLDGLANPAIITGLEALGRGHDLVKLDTFIAGAAQTLGPAVTEYLNVPEYLERRATAVGLNTEGLVRTAEEVQQERAAAQQAQMAQAATPEIVRQAGNAMQQGEA